MKLPSRAGVEHLVSGVLSRVGIREPRLASTAEDLAVLVGEYQRRGYQAQRLTEDGPIQGVQYADDVYAITPPSGTKLRPAAWQQADSFYVLLVRQHDAISGYVGSNVAQDDKPNSMRELEEIAGKKGLRLSQMGTPPPRIYKPIGKEEFEQIIFGYFRDVLGYDVQRDFFDSKNPHHSHFTITPPGQLVHADGVEVSDIGMWYMSVGFFPQGTQRKVGHLEFDIGNLRQPGKTAYEHPGNEVFQMQKALGLQDCDISTMP